jgi:hypothetical protein
MRLIASISYFVQAVGLIMFAMMLATMSPVRAQVAGTVDELDANIVGGYLNVVGAQPDGKLIIAGSLYALQGVARHSVARLDAGGRLDIGFDPNVESGDLMVQSLASQSRQTGRFSWEENSIRFARMVRRSPLRATTSRG